MRVHSIGLYGLECDETCLRRREIMRNSQQQQQQTNKQKAREKGVGETSSREAEKMRLPTALATRWSSSVLNTRSTAFTFALRHEHTRVPCQFQSISLSAHSSPACSTAVHSRISHEFLRKFSQRTATHHTIQLHNTLVQKGSVLFCVVKAAPLWLHCAAIAANYIIAHQTKLDPSVLEASQIQCPLQATRARVQTRMHGRSAPYTSVHGEGVTLRW